MRRALRAVIAEDLKHVRQLLRFFCEESGIIVVGETESGSEVLDLVEEHAPDLIILDIELEDISGIDVARQIRQQIAYNPKIVFVTGSTDPVNIMTAVNEIGAYYIVKPLKRERWDLAIEKIKEIFYNNKDGQQLPAEGETVIRVQASRKSFPIAEESILMVAKENSKKISHIYLKNGDIFSSTSTIQQIKEQASDLIFETIRGYLVNIRHVSGVTKDAYPAEGFSRRYTILFRGSTLTAPLGRFQEKAFLDRLNAFKHK
jgi:two-component system LytT family response regulator/two-component system response regulator LytT